MRERRGMMRMKKGIFLSVISIILVTVLVFFYLTQTRPSEKEETRIVETRVRAMDSLISDIEQDIERGLHIASVRAFLGMMETMAKNGTYLSDFSSSFQEAVLYGTVGGKALNLTQNSTLSDWAGRIESLAEAFDLDTAIALSAISAVQDTPWEVRVSLKGRLNLTDRKGIASWDRELNISTTIGLEGLEDPLYSLASRGRFVNIIRRSNTTQFVNGSNGSNLILHANASRYIASSLSPGYLQRFEGDFAPSAWGIESIVNMDLLEAAAPEAAHPSRSSVDVVQFGTGESGCLLNETQELDWLRLDSSRLPVYGAGCAS